MPIPSRYSYMQEPYYSAQSYYQTPEPQVQQPEAPGLGQQVAGMVANKGAQYGVNEAMGALTGGGEAASAAGSGLIEGGVGTALDGSTMMANPLLTAGAETPGMFSMGGIGSAGNAILPIAGAIGMGDLLLNKRHGGRGALQGAASGAAIGTGIMPGVGTAVGALLGGGLGYVGNFGDVDRWKEDQDRARKLADSGVTGWKSYVDAQPVLTKGRSKEELTNKSYAADFKGMTPEGFVNNKFANSRNEKDLTGKDIWGYSSFGDTFGNDWFGKFNEGQREQIANKALELGATEGKGQINLQKTDELKNYATELTKALTSNKRR